MHINVKKKRTYPISGLISRSIERLFLLINETLFSFVYRSIIQTIYLIIIRYYSYTLILNIQYSLFIQNPKCKEEHRREIIRWKLNKKHNSFLLKNNFVLVLLKLHHHYLHTGRLKFIATIYFVFLFVLRLAPAMLNFVFWPEMGIWVLFFGDE